LIEQDHVEQRPVHLDGTVVFDQPEFAKTVHEEADAESRFELTKSRTRSDLKTAPAKCPRWHPNDHNATNDCRREQSGSDSTEIGAHDRVHRVTQENDTSTINLVLPRAAPHWRTQ
jgi:hypothetical protein